MANVDVATDKRRGRQRTEDSEPTPTFDTVVGETPAEGQELLSGDGEPMNGAVDEAGADLPSTEGEVSTDLPENSNLEEITIAGEKYRVPVRYREGHILTAGEASQLQQAFNEAVRANNMEKFKSDTGTHEDRQKKLDDYINQYQMGVRRHGGRKSDPVRTRAMAMARAAVKRALEKQGRKPSEFNAEAITLEAEKHVHKFMDQAAEIVARENAPVDIDLNA